MTSVIIIIAKVKKVIAKSVKKTHFYITARVFAIFTHGRDRCKDLLQLIIDMFLKLYYIGTRNQENYYLEHNISLDL